MKNLFKALPFLLLSFLITFVSYGQKVEDPTEWKVEAKKISDNKYDIIFHCTVNNGWHVFSLDPGGDGSFIPPSFSIEKASGLKLIGKVRESGKVIHETIEDIGTINYYKKVDFIQTVEVDGNMNITGEYSYQTCNDEMCLPPKYKPFTIKITDAEAKADNGSEKKNTETDVAVLDDGDSLLINKDGQVQEITEDGDTVSNSQEEAIVGNGKESDKDPLKKQKQKSLLWLFLAALGGGIAAVLTPCVYAMIPITVSFFTKRSKTRQEGIKNAFLYSFSIIFIFTIIGVLITVLFGGNALNNLSTNWIANLFFFAIFVIFGISFLGAFEITLPSSWTSKTDSRAGVSSFGGIFFMALTLVIVSFSCTGPIVGPLLILAGKGGITGPVIGMLGFSIGLALPFALFAVFPGMLNKMAQSGGWLNQVKVTLGFIELMLALKFLSNADLARGWRLLDREIFIVIWIVLAIMLGLYLLGKLKLSHDDAPPKNVYGQEYIGLFRLFLAMTSFSFAVYLVPGLWGAPLNGMSQFLPPMGTQEFIVGGGSPTEAHGHGNDVDGVRPVKYVDEMKIYEPPVVVQSGLVTFFDYDEALAAAKILHKPVMLDFTGINCVNCRKMESQVWSQAEVMRRLKEDFIVASLYCDYDKAKLPESERFYSDELNADVKTLGDWNEHLQASQFNSNTQPFYFFVDEDGNKLAEKGYGYDPDVDAFIEHLDNVLKAYKERDNE